LLLRYPRYVSIYFPKPRRLPTMPNLAPKKCSHPGCPRLTVSGLCSVHKKLQYQKFKRSAEVERPSARQRGYTRRWERARAAYLAEPEHSLCVVCEKIGLVVPATVVDHIQPHHGDPALFWSEENWQGLCDSCHSAWKQRLEKSGRAFGCDLNGFPIDPSHPWAG
jgi:5-methylcytosine-specific restriction protein A